MQLIAIGLTDVNLLYFLQTVNKGFIGARFPGRSRS